MPSNLEIIQWAKQQIDPVIKAVCVSGKARGFITGKELEFLSQRYRAREKYQSLDLSLLPLGRFRYGINHDNKPFLVQIDHVDSGEWKDWVFINYAYSDKTVGAYRPGYGYSGSHLDSVRFILRNPLEAMIEYGCITWHCGHCGRELAPEFRIQGASDHCLKTMTLVPLQGKKYDNV